MDMGHLYVINVAFVVGTNCHVDSEDCKRHRPVQLTSKYPRGIGEQYLYSVLDSAHAGFRRTHYIAGEESQRCIIEGNH